MADLERNYMDPADFSSNGERTDKVKASQEKTNNFSPFLNKGISGNCQNPSVNYKNLRDYAHVLQSWIWQYRMQQAFGAFQSHMLLNLQQFQTSARFQQNINPQEAVRNGFIPGVATPASGSIPPQPRGPDGNFGLKKIFMIC